MGRPFLVEYYQTAGEQFFLCRLCQNSIALALELFHRETRIHSGIFTKAVNIEIDGETHFHEEDGNVVADVYCISCGRPLGYKFIEAHTNVLVVKRGRFRVSSECTNNQAVRQGRFLLDLRKLLKWDRSQIVNAATDEPAGNP